MALALAFEIAIFVIAMIVGGPMFFAMTFFSIACLAMPFLLLGDYLKYRGWMK